ncbi:MAG: ATP synthase F1 subunit epsilon [Proteobacteria bacterium]|nr:ATP synthase F1 subunit epsilon [Pseudomonadota bacterium]
MLKLDLVSPGGQTITGREISSLIIPSAKGELTILPGHIDMISTIGKGTMTIGETEKYVIYGGILEVSKGSDIVVAADKIKKISDLDISVINNELKEIEDKLLSEVLSDVDFSSANSRYEDLQAELGAVRQA